MVPVWMENFYVVLMKEPSIYLSLFSTSSGLFILMLRKSTFFHTTVNSDNIFKKKLPQ